MFASKMIELILLIASHPLTMVQRLIARMRRRRILRQHFKSATTGVATKTMRNELNRLVNTVTDHHSKKVRIL